MIKNKTKNTIVSGNFKRIESIFDKTLGLIGKNEPQTYILKTRAGIHTFGVRFPIDILILDDKLKVRYVKEALKPNRVFFWNPKYNLVVELKNGSVKNSRTKTGDYLEFKL